LVRLASQCLEFFPDVRVDFRADLDTLHKYTMIDKTRNVKVEA
jgi:hypothetical protein